MNIRVNDSWLRLLVGEQYEAFCSDYYHRRTLHARGVAQVLSNALTESELVQRVKQNSSRVRLREGWSDETGGHHEVSLEAAALDAALRAGRTIMISNVERLWPEVAIVLRALRTELMALGEMDAGAFISGAKAGYGLHYDSSSMFLVQISGSKRWRVGRTPAVEWPRAGRVASAAELLALQTSPDTLEELVLTPGDVLYLPAGTWHQGWAVGRSFHISLTLFHLDELVEIMRLTPEFVSSIRPPVCAPCRDPLAFRDAVAEALRRELKRVEAWDGAAVSDLWNELVATYDRGPHAKFIEYEPHARIGIVQNPLLPENESSELILDGRVVARMPREAVALLETERGWSQVELFLKESMLLDE